MSFLTKLLEHYHLNCKDLDARNASGSFEFLKRPDGIPSYQSFLKSLMTIIDKKEKTVIYGDYDVDGLTSVAILKIALDKIGLNPGFFIPSRYIEGYGLNSERVKQFHDKGYQVIITCDNGITQFDSIALAVSLGMKVLVIDHHEKSDKYPAFESLFHQIYSGFLDYNCSAASLCYFVASSLLKKDDPYLATLAGLAVFSDSMPLVGNNYQFAKLALMFLNRYRYPNLLSLIGTKKKIDYSDINFNLNSPLNSVGRIRKDSLSTNNACRFLLCNTLGSKYDKYAKEILSCNEEKKELVKKITFLNQFTMETSYGICLRTNSYSGLTGLFANKILREKKIPVAVFSQSESDQDVLVCSLRAPSGLKADGFLNQNESLFLTKGGHEQACGFTIRKDDYFKVVTAFMTYFIKAFMDFTPAKEDFIEISLDEVNRDNYFTLEQFMPFGESFKAPEFLVDIPIASFKIAKSGKVAFADSCDKTGKVVLFSHLDELKKKLDFIDSQKSSNPESDSDFGYVQITGEFSREEYLQKESFRIMAQSFIIKE